MPADAVTDTPRVGGATATLGGRRTRNSSVHRCGACTGRAAASARNHRTSVLSVRGKAKPTGGPLVKNSINRNTKKKKKCKEARLLVRAMSKRGRDNDEEDEREKDGEEEDEELKLSLAEREVDAGRALNGLPEWRVGRVRAREAVLRVAERAHGRWMNARQIGLELRWAGWRPRWSDQGVQEILAKKKPLEMSVLESREGVRFYALERPDDDVARRELPRLLLQLGGVENDGVVELARSAAVSRRMIAAWKGPSDTAESLRVERAIDVAARAMQVEFDGKTLRFEDDPFFVGDDADDEDGFEDVEEDDDYEECVEEDSDGNLKLQCCRGLYEALVNKKDRNLGAEKMVRDVLQKHFAIWRPNGGTVALVMLALYERQIGDRSLQVAMQRHFGAMAQDELAVGGEKEMREFAELFVAQCQGLKFVVSSDDAAVVAWDAMAVSVFSPPELVYDIVMFRQAVKKSAVRYVEMEPDERYVWLESSDGKQKASTFFFRFRAPIVLDADTMCLPSSSLLLRGVSKKNKEEEEEEGVAVEFPGGRMRLVLKDAQDYFSLRLDDWDGSGSGALVMQGGFLMGMATVETTGKPDATASKSFSLCVFFEDVLFAQTTVRIGRRALRNQVEIDNSLPWSPRSLREQIEAQNRNSVVSPLVRVASTLPDSQAVATLYDPVRSNNEISPAVAEFVQAVAWNMAFRAPHPWPSQTLRMEDLVVVSWKVQQKIVREMEEAAADRKQLEKVEKEQKK